MTDSNLTRCALVKEATRNTTPSNPIFQVMRATAISLTDNNQTVVSDEIRSDRMAGPEILVGRGGGEGFNFEFSNGRFDDLLVSSLLGTRTRIAYKFNNGVADSEITAVTDSSDTYTVNSGGAGNDLIYGNGGNDTICGDEGADTVYGGAGADVIYADRSDTILGLEPHDLVL
jgi:Ca2+-binding RTX toxin-like protein